MEQPGDRPAQSEPDLADQTTEHRSYLRGIQAKVGQRPKLCQLLALVRVVIGLVLPRGMAASQGALYAVETVFLGLPATEDQRSHGPRFLSGRLGAKGIELVFETQVGESTEEWCLILTPLKRREF